MSSSDTQCVPLSPKHQVCPAREINSVQQQQHHPTGTCCCTSVLLLACCWWHSGLSRGGFWCHRHRRAPGAGLHCEAGCDGRQRQSGFASSVTRGRNPCPAWGLLRSAHNGGHCEAGCTSAKKCSVPSHPALQWRAQKEGLGGAWRGGGGRAFTSPHDGQLAAGCVHCTGCTCAVSWALSKGCPHEHDVHTALMHAAVQRTQQTQCDAFITSQGAISGTAHSRWHGRQHYHGQAVPGSAACWLCT